MSAKDKWMYRSTGSGNARYRLFCFPYAGSGASMYAGLGKYIDEEIEVCPIQLPGRENRRNESLCSDVEKIISELCDAMKDLLDKPFGIFGYSMGGILAYELTAKLYERFHVKPVRLFMAASSIFREKKPVEVSSMNEHQLVTYMRKSNGVPERVMADEFLWKNYEPIIVNDYKLIENYRFSYHKVQCGIVAFASREDREVKYRNIRLLKYFAPKFELYPMSGNHFFIREESRRIGEIVSREMESCSA